jgi:hypothetical protein
MVLGEAVGQTFVAPRGDLRSVTVWRYAVQESLAFGIHLLVCSVDSLDAPHPEQILLDGPTLHEYGDGIHHTPFQYILDPPLHLASGSYCIFFKVDPCDAWSDLLTTNRGAYASGSEWRTSRNLLNCALRPSPNQHPDWDLVFSVDVDTTGVEVTAFSAVFADSGAVVQWSAANTRCVSTFRIERSEGNCGDYQPVADVAPSPDSTAQYTWIDHDLASGRTYCYKLQALETNGGSQSRGPVIVTTPERSDTTALSMTGFSAVLTDSGALVTWSAANTQWVSTFRIERSDGSCSSYQAVADVPPSSDSTAQYAWLDRDLAPGWAYCYELRALKTGGGSQSRGPVIVTTPEPPAVLPLSLSVRPNPASGAVTVELTLPEAVNVSIDVFDIAGHRVARLQRGSLGSGRSEITWNGRDDDGNVTAAGVYLMKARIGTITLTRRLVRIR